jgi:membrane associated rhomboid family serine protease
MPYSSVPTIGKSIKYLLIVTAAIFVVQMVPYVGPYFLEYGALISSRVFAHGELWRLVTYMFLHGNFWHLFFNLFALWMFGNELEQLWGTRRFLSFYFVGGIGSALFSVILWNTPIIGASGALYAVLVAYGIYFPDRQILLFFIIPIRARYAAIIFFFITLFAGGQGVANMTHLGGIVVGFLYLRAYPLYERFRAEREAVNRENRRRKWAEDALQREKQFEEVIDPILKKISEQGMNSLTRKEKKILKGASKETKEKIKRTKVIPFDLFK